MDAIRLKSSCICGNTSPYLACCGCFAQAPDPAIAEEAGRKWADFRHVFHELCMYLFPLRNLYEAYWEKLSREDYPHHLLMGDPEYGRAMMANFFWDYSVQFSDARPILRAARDVEGKDLRMANDFRQWSLAPLRPGLVVEADRWHGHLRMQGSEKLHRVAHGGALPEPGTHVAVRLLSYRGGEYVHPAILTLPRDGFSKDSPEADLLKVCDSLGLKSMAGLRPDVHCNEWRRHGALFLEVWRQRAYDAVVGVPARTLIPAPEIHIKVTHTTITARKLAASNAVPMGRGRFEVRHRNLPLARVEMRGGAVHGALMDEAFRPRVLRWLEEHLNVIGEGGREKSISPFSKAGLEIWIQEPLSILNDETPVQASLHDIGRRKLQTLLRDFSRQGRDISMTRQRLGL